MTANQLQYWSLQETRKTNRAREAETHRANVESEKIKYLELEHKGKELGLKGQELEEYIRSNLAKEGISRREVKEKERHNKVSEKQGWANTLINAITSGSKLGQTVGSLLG